MCMGQSYNTQPPFLEPHFPVSSICSALSAGVYLSHSHLLVHTLASSLWVHPSYKFLHWLLSVFLSWLLGQNWLAAFCYSFIASYSAMCNCCCSLTWGCVSLYKLMHQVHSSQQNLLFAAPSIIAVPLSLFDCSPLAFCKDLPVQEPEDVTIHNMPSMHWDSCMTKLTVRCTSEELTFKKCSFTQHCKGALKTREGASGFPSIPFLPGERAAKGFHLH